MVGLQNIKFIFVVLSLFVDPIWSQALMAVDMSNEFIKVGSTKPGMPMETVLNKGSQRKTLNVIAFSENGEERFIGHSAMSIYRKKPECVFFHPFFLLGKLYNSSATQMYKKRWPHVSLVENNETNGVYFVIKHKENEIKFSPETLVAMILQDIRSFTESFLGEKVSASVIAVPPYTDMITKIYLKRVMKIANIYYLGIVDANVALGLKYTIFKRKELNEKNITVAIVDVGSYKTDSTVYECSITTKGKKKDIPTCTIKGYGYVLDGVSRHTECVVDEMAILFENKFKKSLKSILNSRLKYALYEEAVKVKHSLTGIKEARFHLEQFYNDNDWTGVIKRDDVDARCAETFDKLLKSIDQAIELSSFSGQLDQVIMMGAGSRIPSIQNKIMKKTKVDNLANILNTDEDIALGASFEAAKLSPSYRVADIECNRTLIHPISISFPKLSLDDKTNDVKETIVEKILFQYNEKSNTKKVLTLKNVSNKMSVLFKYGQIPKKYDLTTLSENYELYRYNINGAQDYLQQYEENYETVGLRLHIVIDNFGILSVTGSEMVFNLKNKSTFAKIKDKVSEFFGKGASENKIESSEEEEKVDAKNESKRESIIDKNISEATLNLTTETNGTNVEKKLEKQVIVNVDMTKDALHYKLPSDNILEESIALLKTMNDREAKKERNDKTRNTLESNIFNARDKLEVESFLKYISEEEKTDLKEALERISSWFDENGQDANYTELLNITRELKNSFKFANERIDEEVNIEKSITKVNEYLTNAKSFVELISNNTVYAELLNMTEFSNYTENLKEIQKMVDQDFKKEKLLKPWENKTVTSGTIKKKLANIQIEGSKHMNIIIDYTKKVEKEKEEVKKKEKAKQKEQEKLKKEAESKANKSSNETVVDETKKEQDKEPEIKDEKSEETPLDDNVPSEDNEKQAKENENTSDTTADRSVEL